MGFWLRAYLLLRLEFQHEMAELVLHITVDEKIVISHKIKEI